MKHQTLFAKLWSGFSGVLKPVCVAATVLSSAEVLAGEQTGQVSFLILRASDGLVYFSLSGQVSARPSCATQNYWIIKDENSAAGKRQIAALMVAKATGGSIKILGSNTCTRWNDGEDVNEVQYLQ